MRCLDGACSALELHALERIAARCAAAFDPLCAERRAGSRAVRAHDVPACAAYFDLRVHAPVALTLGIGIVRDLPDPGPSGALAAVALDSVTVEARAVFAEGTIDAAAFVRLAAGRRRRAGHQGRRSGILEPRGQTPRYGRPWRRGFAHGIPRPRRRDGSPFSVMSEQGKNLDLLMNVPLKVTAELGTCKMLVRDILKLGTGSVVELDRLAGGPVDLLVNDRLVARGEVVAIDENFGVRITELIEKP